MRKVILLLSFLGLFATAQARDWYFDFGIDEIPTMIVGVDAKSGSNFVTFFNIANLRLSFNLNDQLGLNFQLKDTYISLTNEDIVATNQNKLYMDRLYLKYESDRWETKLGRATFVEDNGMLIGNVADGFFGRISLGGFNFRGYALYSGLLPTDINAFNANQIEQVNGANRLLSGLVIQKIGWGLDEMDIKFLYSKDFATNSVSNTYNPIYLSTSGNWLIGSQLNLSYNVIYTLGMRGTESDMKHISAYAGELSLMLVGKGGLMGLLARASLASGDTGGEKYTGFRSSSVYDTGFVLVPKFSNMLMLKLGLAAQSKDENLKFGLSYYYMTRMNTNDTVDGFYTGAESGIGHEVSTSFTYHFDPNIGVFVNAGFFLKEFAFESQDNVMKIIVGSKISF